MTSDLGTTRPATDATAGATPVPGRPHGAPGGSHPSLRDRLAPALPYEIWGWAGPGLVAFIAGVMRFWRLGVPRDFVFDETYYAKDGWSLLRFGYEHSWVDKSDPTVLAGRAGEALGQGPAFIVHPPLGKWMIGLGETLFGFNPLGWRIVVALVATVSVLILARIARRLTHSTLLGCVAGLLLAFDGLHFVMSRAALLDLLLMTWILAAFGALVVDRTKARERLVGLVESQPGAMTGWGPTLGTRPWRIAAGVFLGCACATKWSGVFAVATFGLMTVLWDRGARQAVGVRAPWRATLRRDVGPAFLSVVGVALVVYLASWTGWMVTDGGWSRHWAAHRDTAFPFVPEVLRSLWHYHYEMFNFHTHLATPHTYESNPWGWLLIARPVSYYFLTLHQGENGCELDTCYSAVLAMGTPVLWWMAIVALGHMVWRWLARRDWRAGAILAGVSGTYLPWFLYTDRTIFYFYAVSCLPFLVLAVTLTLGSILGGPNVSPARRAWGSTVAGIVVVLVLVNFTWLYPILSAQPISVDQWHARMWLRSWI